jgi:hypothetical protein
MRVVASWCLSRSCACDRIQDVLQNSETCILSSLPVSAGRRCLNGASHERVPITWSVEHMHLHVPEGLRSEVESDKGAENQVQNGQILTFRILTRGVEVGQAFVTHRSSTCATTLARMGSIGFTCVTQEAGERVKFESQSRISIVSAISYSSSIDRASHALWHTLPTHIIASP